MRTLMATDGSKEATLALRTASRLLRKKINEVHLLCVAPELGSQRPDRGAAQEKETKMREEYRRRISRETKTILQQSREVLHKNEIDAIAMWEIGSPASTIVRLAEDYDVTVVGAKGRNTDSELGLGPVASRVVEHAPGTVLVARELVNESSLRVLLAIDGSLASKNAIHTMIKQFDLGSSEITLMHVKETPWLHLGLDREWFDYPEDLTDEVTLDRADPDLKLEQELQREAEEVIEQARSELIKYDYSVMTLIEEGNPATEILGEAEKGDYDLIVLGSTGVIDTKHNVLGSVSARVAWQALCSVAVVKFMD
jgi:nucleotide-binding universal stress UspA family protein